MEMKAADINSSESKPASCASFLTPLFVPCRFVDMAPQPSRRRAAAGGGDMDDEGDSELADGQHAGAPSQQSVSR